MSALTRISRNRHLRSLLATARYAGLRALNPRRLTYRGVVVPLAATDKLESIRGMVTDQIYESAELDALSELIRPDDVVLEAGAGCGVVSTFVAQRLADSRNLHSYEANPELLSSIRAVAEANGVEFDLQHAAVADRDGELSFFVDPKLLSSSATDRGRGADEVRVPCASMRRLLDEIQPTVVLFDIEGGEEAFVDLQWPAQVRVISCEVHPHVLGDETTTALVRSILDQGFSLLIDLCSRRALSFARLKDR
jgi:FkbM family methyltransferase